MYILALTLEVDATQRTRLNEAVRKVVVYGKRGNPLLVHMGVDADAARSHKPDEQVSVGAGWVLYRVPPQSASEPSAESVHVALLHAHKESLN